MTLGGLGKSWQRFGALLGGHEASSGPSWGDVGRSRGSWGDAGASWHGLGAVLGALGEVLASTWAVSGAILTSLVASWGGLGRG